MAVRACPHTWEVKMGLTPLPGRGTRTLSPPPFPGSLSYLDQLEGEALVEDAVDASSS